MSFYDEAVGTSVRQYHFPTSTRGEPDRARFCSKCALLTIVDADQTARTSGGVPPHLVMLACAVTMIGIVFFSQVWRNVFFQIDEDDKAQAEAKWVALSLNDLYEFKDEGMEKLYQEARWVLCLSFFVYFFVSFFLCFFVSFLLTFFLSYLLSFFRFSLSLSLRLFVYPGLTLSLSSSSHPFRPPHHSARLSKVLENYFTTALQALLVGALVRMTSFMGDDLDNPVTRMTVTRLPILEGGPNEVPKGLLMLIEPQIFVLLILALPLGFVVLYCRPVCIIKVAVSYPHHSLCRLLYSTVRFALPSDDTTGSLQTFWKICLFCVSFLHLLHLRGPQLSLRLRARSFASVGGQDRQDLRIRDAHCIDLPYFNLSPPSVRA